MKPQNDSLKKKKNYGGKQTPLKSYLEKCVLKARQQGHRPSGSQNHIKQSLFLALKSKHDAILSQNGDTVSPFPPANLSPLPFLFPILQWHLLILPPRRRHRISLHLLSKYPSISIPLSLLLQYHLSQNSLLSNSLLFALQLQSRNGFSLTS